MTFLHEMNSVCVDDGAATAQTAQDTGGLYGVYHFAREACAVAVRPDAHLALVSALNALGEESVARYLRDL